MYKWYQKVPERQHQQFTPVYIGWWVEDDCIAVKTIKYLSSVILKKMFFFQVKSKAAFLSTQTETLGRKRLLINDNRNELASRTFHSIKSKVSTCLNTWCVVDLWTQGFPHWQKNSPDLKKASDRQAACVRLCHFYWKGRLNLRTWISVGGVRNLYAAIRIVFTRFGLKVKKKCIRYSKTRKCILGACELWGWGGGFSPGNKKIYFLIGR